MCERLEYVKRDEERVKKERSRQTWIEGWTDGQTAEIVISRAPVGAKKDLIWSVKERNNKTVTLLISEKNVNCSFEDTSYASLWMRLTVHLTSDHCNIQGQLRWLCAFEGICTSAFSDCVVSNDLYRWTEQDMLYMKHKENFDRIFSFKFCELELLS